MIEIRRQGKRKRYLPKTMASKAKNRAIEVVRRRGKAPSVVLTTESDTHNYMTFISFDEMKEINEVYRRFKLENYKARKQDY